MKEKIYINGYIARDLNGDLFLYLNKPYKDGEKWFTKGFKRINKKSFFFIKWTDKEPTQVKITIEIDK